MNYEWSNSFVEGFQPTYHFWQKKIGVHGFVGYLPRTDMIYVVFRAGVGEAGLRSDQDMKLVPYLMWPECNCRVHRGYQNSVIAVYP